MLDGIIHAVQQLVDITQMGAELYVEGMFVDGRGKDVGSLIVFAAVDELTRSENCLAGGKVGPCRRLIRKPRRRCREYQHKQP
ncbi:MAG: hypothetical protein J7M26_03880 [Armatimonadetes bacterium]|nr:hypothetical protein [Armatimonadota bacterium]